MTARNTAQGMPALQTPLVDESGNVNPIWFKFFVTLFTRSGGQLGNNSPYFNYPENVGTSGQHFTSQGPEMPGQYITITPVTNNSQLVNDTNYLTNATGNSFILAAESNATPLVNSGSGSPGNDTTISRSDHIHPTDTSRLDAALITGSGRANPGFITLPTGLQMAFGSNIVTLSGSQGTLNYGHSFPSACITVIASNGDDTMNTGSVDLGFLGASSAIIVCPNSTGGLFHVNFIAIGY